MVHAPNIFDCMYPIASGKRPMGKPRKAPYGVEDANRGVIYDCLACIARLHRLHPNHTRHNESPLLCRHYYDTPAMWDCERCLRARPQEHPDHHVGTSCKSGLGGLATEKRRRQMFGVPVGAGLCRDPAIPAVGQRDSGPIIDNLDVDADVGPPLEETDTQAFYAACDETLS